MSDCLFENLSVTAKPLRTEKCRQCKNLQLWRNEYVSLSHQVNFYCGVHKSGRTDNGLLKVRRKNTACELFVQEQD